MHPTHSAATTDARAGVIVIANPYSGRGENEPRVAKLVLALKQRGVEARVCWTPTARRDVLRDPDLVRRSATLVIAGGDGTISDVVNELHHYHELGAVPLATLPLGNENLFARQFGFAADPLALAEALTGPDAHATPCDMGVLEAADRSQVFTLMASAGFDAEVVRRVHAWRVREQIEQAQRNGDALAGPRHAGRRIRSLNYLPKIARAAAAYRYPAIRVSVTPDDGADPATFEAHQVFVFNLPQYGGGMRIAPAADPTDGRLYYVALTHPGRVAMTRFAWLVRRGLHLRDPAVRHGRATRVQLDAPHDSAPLQADGDFVGSTPCIIRALPAAARVLIPTHSAANGRDRTDRLPSIESEPHRSPSGATSPS